MSVINQSPLVLCHDGDVECSFRFIKWLRENEFAEISIDPDWRTRATVVADQTGRSGVQVERFETPKDGSRTGMSADLETLESLEESRHRLVLVLDVNNDVKQSVAIRGRVRVEGFHL